MDPRHQSAGIASGSAPAPKAAPFQGLPPALPLRSGALAVRELINLYMAHYAGRDTARIYRLSWWAAKIGDIALQDLSDDHVHAALQSLEEQSSRYFAGKDADGAPIYKAKKRPIAPGTINRYSASLAAVVTWAIKKRIAPKGFVHPCRSIERRTENNEQVRFLSDDEREQLLQSCREAAWARLYLLALMALTTGARKGALMGLHWQDIDLARAEAHCGRTKNGSPIVLPLVPAVVELLTPLQDKPTHLVFGSPKDMTRPFSFEPQWVQAVKRAGIGKFRFHDLRHSCASMLAANGATLLEIAEVLGHRQLQMTKRYSHLTTQHKSSLINRVMGQIR